MNEDSRITVIGSNMIDLITYAPRNPEPGETLAATDFAMGFGGKGANQAVAAALLGSRVAMVSKVGDDDFANGTLANFARYGIDTHHVTRVAGTASGVAPILVEPSGENRILIAPGANRYLLPTDLEAAGGTIRGSALVLFQLEVPVETVSAGLLLARAAGARTILNPAPAQELSSDTLAAVDYLILNESELALLSGAAPGKEVKIATAAARLRDAGVGHVIVTLGARGACLLDENGLQEVEAVPVSPVDTAGAGDAFIGSFAHFLSSGVGILPSLRHAAKYAAMSVTKRGTQSSYPDAETFARS